MKQLNEITGIYSENCYCNFLIMCLCHTVVFGYDRVSSTLNNNAMADNVVCADFSDAFTSMEIWNERDNKIIPWPRFLGQRYHK